MTPPTKNVAYSPRSSQSAVGWNSSDPASRLGALTSLEADSRRIPPSLSGVSSRTPVTRAGQHSVHETPPGEKKRHGKSGVTVATNNVAARDGERSN